MRIIVIIAASTLLCGCASVKIGSLTATTKGGDSLTLSNLVYSSSRDVSIQAGSNGWTFTASGAGARQDAGDAISKAVAAAVTAATK
jgi:hypothetical protein